MIDAIAPFLGLKGEESSYSLTETGNVDPP